MYALDALYVHVLYIIWFLLVRFLNLAPARREGESHYNDREAEIVVDIVKDFIEGWLDPTEVGCKYLCRSCSL